MSVKASLRRRLAVPADRAYPRAILVATGLLYLTVLMGVSTRATGAGLACSANWPLCDGGLLNLFPASMPSAFEWVHRVIAMVAGFSVLGAAIVTWRANAPRGVLALVALGLGLLPVQVLLGRETVLTFTPPVLAAHYWVAMTIYSAFALAAVRVYPSTHTRTNVRRSLLLATGLVPIGIVLGPPVIVRYSAPIQATQYAVVLVALAALLFATIASWETYPDRRAFRGSVLAATALLPIVVALMRQRIIHPESAIASLHPIAAMLLLGALVAATVWSVRS